MSASVSYKRIIFLILSNCLLCGWARGRSSGKATNSLSLSFKACTYSFSSATLSLSSPMFVSSVRFSFWSSKHRSCWNEASQHELLALKVFVVKYLVLKNSNTPAVQRAEPALVPSPLTSVAAGCAGRSVSPPALPAAPAAPHTHRQERQLFLAKIAALPALTGSRTTTTKKRDSHGLQLKTSNNPAFATTLTSCWRQALWYLAFSLSRLS